ncbi:MAG: ABC transporter permease [Chloroflexi bacterium]|nr:ABC transporter permease [Chloroflexota bacterium]MBI2980645.1 ABC transporter permease [Chloroflexota bacterium]
MKLIEFIGIAIKSLLANKLRSSLTMLGMIIGVSAVIILMSVGAGIQHMITSTFEELGTNLLFVQPSNPEAPGMMGVMYGSFTANINMDDVEAISHIRSITSVAPTNENFVEIIAGNEKTTAVIHGSNPAYQQVYQFRIATGQFISEVNLARRDMVVVIGSKVAETLFGSADPVGQQVKIRDKRFTVIGALEPRGLSSFGFSWDELVVTPITTFQSRLFSQKTPGGEDAVQQIAIQVASAEVLDEVTEDIKTILRKRHRITSSEDDDFAVTSPQQLLGTFETITFALTIFLGLIGAISLLVGGIGIMNIMLVSVTERTREIGIRKAVGAKRRDILTQFLLEAAMLSLTGGAIGLVSAWLIAHAISLVDLGGFRINAVVSPFIVTIAVLVSVVIGLTSGIYPAMRAARLNPIDALHYG